MTFALLYIRLKQLQREANALGLYLFLVIIIFFLAIFLCFKQFENGKNAYYVIGSLVLVCLYLQSSRKDTLFVYKHIENPHLQIFSEYVALTLPFSISAIVTKNWFCYPLLILILFCLPFFKFSYREKTIFKNLSSVIPASNFEWLSGFRKNYIFFSTLYVLAISFCWLRILPLFLLWFLTMVIISFHSECESIGMLREGNKLPRKFLSGKLTINSYYLLILYTPVLIINSIFNSEFLFFNLLFIPIQISLLCFAICLKYAAYAPNKSQVANNVPLLIVSLGSPVPYLLPVPVLLAFIYFYRAEKKLNPYLNDQH